MATCYERVSVDDCNQILSACEGLLISHVWRSIDPCVCLEIGRLSEDDAGREHGRLTLMTECHWRIERLRSIQVGSDFSARRIDNQLATLIGIAVSAIEISGRVPEISIDFGDGRRFRTFANWDRQPRWSIGFNDCSLFPLDPRWEGIDVTPWISVRSGRLEIEYCYDDSEASVRKTVKRIGFV
jgi:hypothetical protein